MLHLSASCRYYLCTAPTDLRKHFDSLSGLVTTVMNQNVLSGDMFIFINRKHNQIKLLLFEGDGFAIYHKRLEKGTYEVPVAGSETGSVIVSQQQLVLLLQGISLRHVCKRKRYQHQPQIC